MKTLFVAAVIFGFGFMVARNIYQIKPIKPPFEELDETVSRTQPKKENDNIYAMIYKRLGIESGDMIKEVNGIRADNSALIFPEMIRAFSLGDLCVTFSRNEGLRKSCFKKTAQGEEVRVSLLDSSLRKPRNPAEALQQYNEMNAAPKFKIEATGTVESFKDIQ